MRLRQIALVAADLPRVLEDLRAVFGLGDAFADPGVGVFGLANGVLPVGEHFLEVVSPTQAGTTAGRYLERRGGDGGYMAIFQTRDLARRRAHFARCGVRTAWEVALDDIATVHLHPRDTGGTLVSVDEARPYESWRWAGPGWRARVRNERVRGVAGIEIQSPDPQALSARWSDVFELRSDGTRATLDDGGTIAFVPDQDGRGEGLRSVLLHAVDAGAVHRAARARGAAVETDGAVVLGGVRFLPVVRR